ncbi:MAG: hypothetical protein ACE5GX_15325 [Thermoanaerobaculia bacterium]
MVFAIRLVLTVVFGIVWIWVYNYTDASIIVILGSILALCVCCCRGHGDPPSKWNWNHYFECLRRCRTALLTLMVALFLIGVLWPVVNGNPMPAGAVLVQLAVGAIGAVWLIRLICCLYD